MKECDLFQNLHETIESYDKILFLPHGLQEYAMLSDINSIKCSEKKIKLILGDIIGESLSGKNLQRLDEEACVILCRLYYTYEFSNKFIMLLPDSNFGTIFNYVKTGLLSFEEATSALLE